MDQTIVILSDAAVDVVQELVQLNIDSAEGYAAAARRIHDGHLAALFREYAIQRQENAEELKTAILQNMENPPQSGTVRGMLHRWWLELRDWVSGDDIAAMLVEVERGEDTIKQRYEAALAEVTGNPIEEVLTKQYVSIKQAHDHIRELRDIHKPPISE